ncbi:hypothetical protein BT63DRAFT_422185 [Microthyrium microscopicum]|uniref:Uncharacterized protein n=1 Tax=Microthyrium microscopicum TaxID=703497 RepID=A0A6A6UIV4_9PEZI|nr:hypothetical protein BT63DRAFT_422185 [Microthyrium microscopicum]
MSNSVASSSNASAPGTVRRRANWVTPSILPSIKAPNGQGIQNPDLLAIARTLESLDSIILSITLSAYRLIIDGVLNQDDPAGQNEAQVVTASIRMISQQFGDILMGRAEFSDGYLTERVFIEYWQKSTRIACQLMPAELNSPNSIQWVSEQLGSAEQKATILVGQILHAAPRGSLTRDIVFMLSERWTRLDECLDFRAQCCNMPRNVDTWDSLSKKIDDQLKLDRKSGFWSRTVILWLTFSITTIATIPLFALGYSFSPHQHGTFEDADFWFLLQSSLTQLLGTVLSFIPIYKENKLPRRVSITLMIAALLATLLATPLYILVPTEWSGFLSIIGASIQAFQVLQIVISED